MVFSFTKHLYPDIVTPLFPQDLLPITTVEDLLTKMFPLKEEDDLQELFSTAKRLATSSKDPTKMRVSALTWPVLHLLSGANKTMINSI